jgi:glutamate synthase domain-containing protein 2/glutamate synthase domain-containing protein 1/glutamate synthase domain-containing protein 3
LFDEFHLKKRIKAMKDDVPQPLLYDSQFEHDACGVGFIANIFGTKTHALIETALQALTNLAHRGAIDADGKTGDGAGLLTQIPHKLFLREIEKLGGVCDDPSALAVGVFFLPRDKKLQSRCRKIVEQVLNDYSLQLYGWRKVPTDKNALGTKAAGTAPVIEQALIGRGNGAASEYERILYLVRKEIARQTATIEGFYIPSLSSQTIVYKGLLLAAQMKDFYKDLNDADFESALVVFHQRYSTNTFPNWSLAQPFRMLAHNGEINTVEGNRNWMRAREAELQSHIWKKRVEKLKPIIWTKGSDSASLDNALELLVKSGRDPLHAMMMLIPEAHENASQMNQELRGFYEYAACLMEAWDGPASVAFSDGKYVGAISDRNGLRPARYAITNDGFIIVASEAGVVELATETIIEKGRLAPGKMIAVDTTKGIVLSDEKIKYERARQKHYTDWVRRSILICPNEADANCADASDELDLMTRMKSFGYTIEDVQRILLPMLEEGKEPIGSMGDDTPLAVLSAKPRVLYNYFKQRFAQVTNPAIDPIRERSVMSLEMLLGARGSILEEFQSHAKLIKLRSPILTIAEIEWLKKAGKHGFSSATLNTLFEVNDQANSLEQALESLCQQASEAVKDGHAILILSDKGVNEKLAPIPMLLAVATVHHHLIREGKRMRASLVVETGEAREDHHFACLIGYGANAVNPYLAFEIVADEVNKRGMSAPAALKNYKSAVESGILKILAKMGIATIASYCGAQIFEAIGLHQSLVEKYFTGTPSRIGGLTLKEIAADVLQFHAAAFDTEVAHLEDAGFYRYRSGGEYHTFNPNVFRPLHKFAKRGDTAEYAHYSEQIEKRPPAALRDLLDFRAGNAIPLEEVEGAENIARRFSTSGMSLGALSKEAHETLAIGMNRLGAKSNSGEGGESSARYRISEDGDSANSRIKQVASARFGVTPEYLVSADELEIKIAQGSKPGEGGQLPGHKVTAEIAAIRHSVPGVTLISPPPHHDIYSIEDLAQLIFDLKQINPRARVAVKLVSEAGIGTVAAGVAKAFADVIHIGGHDGGTGASPLGSIKNAGGPWELGLAETQQTLALNDLRSRVKLRVDGGIKAGRDVVIAAMLGAEEFGFATSALVALGCVMARQCHLNTCPVGIATQVKGLRERFAGKPEMVVNFFMELATEVREILARLGFSSIDEIIGRSDLLVEKTDVELPKKVKLDLRALLAQVNENIPRRFLVSVSPQTNEEEEDSLGDMVLKKVTRAITKTKPIVLEETIKNTDRAIGAKVSGHIARLHGNAGLPEKTVDLIFHGSAGQSFGAFAISGMKLTVIGEANDYVGKGMAGGEIVVRPPQEAQFEWSENVIIGNTVLYGATGGALFAAGRAGERFAVRNSGAVAVVEGVGDHGCEYMTAGVIVVLGEVGRNFAAGMTGGVAYVLDEDSRFEKNCNHELVRLAPVGSLQDQMVLRLLIQRHYELTGSPRALKTLWKWDEHKGMFWQVITQGAQVMRKMGVVENVVQVQTEKQSNERSGKAIAVNS